MDVSKLAPYAKAVAAFLAGLTAFVAVVVTAVADNTITVEEGINLIVNLTTWLGGTFAVFQVTNKKVSK